MSSKIFWIVSKKAGMTFFPNQLLLFPLTLSFDDEFPLTVPPEDEFPLLYSNIYNTYARRDNPLMGVCCVYRIQRNGTGFASTLVQLIEIGFVSDSSLWCSAGEQPDIRPYGNFVVDRENGKYYGFTMRDATQSTRYFSFRLPALTDGERDEKYGVKKVVLQPSDILASFDCPYHHFVQGACIHGDKLYSLEGFTKNGENPPAIRVIDLQNKRQELYMPFADLGLEVEPELIDFCGDVCYYGDRHGNLYNLSFQK